MLLVPQIIFRNVTHISVEWLKKNHISALVLDVDNTLTLHDDPNISPEIRSWLDELQAAGVKLMIASNNGEERVSRFAKAIGLDYVADARKPLNDGLRRAQQKWQVPKAQMAIVGDQLFTDRLAGSLYGIQALTTLPLGPETKWYIKLKRVLETPFMALYRLFGGKIL